MTQRIWRSRKEVARTTLQVLELTQEGFPQHVIAQKLGLSRFTVWYHLKRLGGIKRVRQGHVFTQQEVAMLLGIPANTLRDWVAKGFIQVRRAARSKKRRRAHTLIPSDFLMDFLADQQYFPLLDPSKIPDAYWREYALEQRELAGGAWLGTPEMARFYQVEIKTVNAWIAKKLFPVHFFNGRYYAWSRDLIDFVPPYLS